MNLPKLNYTHAVATGRWHSTKKNPAEDTWHVNSLDFVRGVWKSDSRAFRQTRNWLAERLWQSKRIATLSGNLEASAMFFVRPCNMATYFWRPDKFARHYYYDNLLECNRTEIKEIAHKLSNELREEIIDVYPEDPSGLLLTYDDDYNALYDAAEKSQRFYEVYCRGKDLISSKS